MIYYLLIGAVVSILFYLFCVSNPKYFQEELGVNNEILPILSIVVLVIWPIFLIALLMDLYDGIHFKE